jgi:hypothetical protein
MHVSAPLKWTSIKSQLGGKEGLEKDQGMREKEINGPDDASSNDREQGLIPGQTIVLGELSSGYPVDDENTGPKDIHYKTCKWWQTGMLMLAETISLGILSLPSVLSKVGLIPGIILLIGMGLFASYSGYVIYQFKMEYPWVKSMADSGEVMFAPLGNTAKQIGREVGGAAQTIFIAFYMASHILTWTICFDALTGHAACNVVWGIVALVVFWMFDLPRTLKKMSYFSVACTVTFTPNALFRLLTPHSIL